MSEREDAKPLSKALLWMTAVGTALSILAQLLQFFTSGLSVVRKIDNVLRDNSEMKQKLEAVETRGINTANELTATRTEMREGFKAINEAVAKKADKRGSR